MNNDLLAIFEDADATAIEIKVSLISII